MGANGCIRKAIAASKDKRGQWFVVADSAVASNRQYDVIPRRSYAEANETYSVYVKHGRPAVIAYGGKVVKVNL